MKPAATRFPLSEQAVVVVAMTVAAFVLSFRLDWQEYWLDEHFTLMFTQFDWSTLMIEHWATDTHRPVYYGLQKAWMAVFGDSIAAVRALPVALSVLLIPVFFAVARRIGPKPAALITVIILVAAPMLVLQGRAVRMYALSNLSLAAALWCAVELSCRARMPVGSSPTRHAGSDTWLWIGFASALALAFYAQAFGILVLALFGLWILICVGLRILPVTFLWRALGALALYVVLILPALYPFFSHAADTLGGDFWIPEPSVRHVYNQITGAYPYPWWSKPVIAALILFGLWQLRTRPDIAWLLGMMVIGLPVLVLVISFYKPIFLSRVIAWGSLVSVPVIAIGLAQTRPLIRWIGVSFVVVSQAVTFPTLVPDAPEYGPERTISEHLQNFDPATDILILGHRYLEPAFQWHAPHVFDGAVFAVTDADHPNPIADAAFDAQFVRLKDLMGIPLGGGRLFVVTATRRTSAPAQEQANVALQAFTNGLPRLRTIAHGSLRLSVFRVPG